MIAAEAVARLEALERKFSALSQNSQVAKLGPPLPASAAPQPAKMPSPQDFALEHIDAIQGRLQGYRKEGETVLATVTRLVADLKAGRVRNRRKARIDAMEGE